MKPLPSLKHPSKPVSHAADLLLLLTKTVLFQLKGTRQGVVGKKSHGYRSSMPAKLDSKNFANMPAVNT